jgi:hypothetical protein
MVDRKKDELVRFLEERAFKPVLNAQPQGRAEAEQQKLERVQKATRAEIERFHKYRSAQEVATNPLARIAAARSSAMASKPVARSIAARIAPNTRAV